MSFAITELILIGFLAGWLGLAIAVGKAAAKKNRRRWLWTILPILPLGPIIGPLWLASMPVAGEKASTGQMIGRSVLILLLIGQLLQGALRNAYQESVRDKAESEFGLVTESKVTHYKKMDVNEIALCVQLGSEVKSMEETATLSESGETYLFETQREVDLYNSAIELNNELECDERTYDYADLDVAMELIESNDVSPIRETLIQRVDSIEFKIAKWNGAAPILIDQSTQLDGVMLQGDEVVVTRFTLIEYGADEVSQIDLEEFFKPSLVSESCSDPDLADLRRDGYTLTYEYRGRDGGYIGTIDLVGDC